MCVHVLIAGADLANLINQAALRASSEGKSEVTQSDVDYANEKIVMGGCGYHIL